ncbi:hypothetical protein [Brachybacterium sp. 107]|uniref:hypothetical protein n=1 Tax=Brachybacterium sp. 107 TaxID=3457736 RepID=UPI00403481BE
MRNATIATSRTRATADHLIDYRPLPAAWGDVEALHELRAAKALAAERGLDPSTLEIAASDGGPRRSRRPLALLRRERGTHARTQRSLQGHAAGSLATA